MTISRRVARPWNAQMIPATPQHVPSRSPSLIEFMKSAILSTVIILTLFQSNSPSLQASNLTVSNLNDSGPGSLRHCIEIARSADIIAFSVTGTTYLTNGALSITNNLNIAGPGANRLSVNGHQAGRVFEIASNAIVYISGLTIEGGKAPDGVFGNYQCDWLAAHGGGGGGILNRGRLVLTHCTAKENRAGNAGQYNCYPGYNVWRPSDGGDGGGIYNLGDFSALGCTFSGNSAGQASNGGIGTYGGNGHVAYFALPGGTGGSGGAIYNLGILSLTNCTIAANAAGAGGNGNSVMWYDHGYSNYEGSSGGNGGSGGGLFNNGQMTIVACTFGENLVGAPGVNSPYAYLFGSGGSGGGIYNANQPSAALVFDTLAASHLGGSFISLGHNLLRLPADGFESGLNSDLVGSPDAPLDPLLGPLQDNGGTTPTMALLPGSPAIDTGKNISGLETDQRGACFSRVCDDPNITNSTDGDGTDIGAFEVQQGACSPANRITSLIAVLPTLSLPQGLANSLSAKLQTAAGALAQGNNQAACANLNALINEVEAHKGKKLSSGQADFLETEVACISIVSDCQ
jgi:hypothetical protein